MDASGLPGTVNTPQAILLAPCKVGAVVPIVQRGTLRLREVSLLRLLALHKTPGRTPCSLCLPEALNLVLWRP